MRRYISALVCALIVVTSVSFVVQALPTQSIGTWAPTGTLPGAPTGASVVTLADGRTLVMGGVLPDDTPTSAVMLYDAELNAMSPVGQLAAARSGHAAAVLSDDRVIVIGGVVDGTASADIEIFDPATGESTVVASLNTSRSQHAAATLLDGTVLIVGGRNAAGVPLANAEIFTVGGSNTTPAANSMSTARAGLTATSLLDGRVLIVGGNNGSDLASAELYYAESQTFDPANTSLNGARSGHSAVLLRHNGGVLIAGGSSDNAAQVKADLFLPPIFPDPFSYGDSSFVATGDMSEARVGAAAGNAVEGYAFAAGGGAQSAEVYRFATVRTDKDDYAPGEPALITGTGWAPNSTVTLLFQEDPAVHPDYTRVNVPTDGDGNFSVNDWAPEQHDLGVRFYLTVSDGISRAQTTFTDATQTNVVVTTSPNPSSPGQTVTITATVREGNVEGSGSLVANGGSVIFRSNAPSNCNQGTQIGAAAVPTVSGVASITTSFPSPAPAIIIRACYDDPTGTYQKEDDEITHVVTAATPELTVTKTNSAVANSIVYGGNWTWTLTGSNATTAANFSAAQTILTDNLPNANISYGAVTVNTSGVTGTISCSISAFNLSCTATTAVTISAGGSFTASFVATPTAFGTYANPRAGGECKIDPAGLIAESNEGNNTCANTVSVTKRAATWTTNPASKTYGDADPNPLTTGSGDFLAADSVTATYTRVAGENAGPPTYHITATLSATPMSALDNYTITNAGAEFTINKRAATWTTNPNSKTYGDTDPTPLTTGSGDFLAADNVTATYGRVAGENASPPTYHITATLSATPMSALDNYTITNAGAEFTINKRAATWTTNPNSKTYGDADPSPLTTGSGDFLAADAVTATYGRVAGENASPPTYHITATLSATPMSALDNYTITNAGAEFTINKRAATWTTNPNSKTYGDADPSPLTTGSGDFLAADAVTATYGRVAGENASPPTYHITATLSATPMSALDNYTITNAGAEFTINKRAATWTTNPNSKTYGDADPSPLTTGSGDFLAADNVTATYGRVAGENASPPTYHITATLSATPMSALDNYNITNVGAEFTINKRTATWTTNAASKTYGDADPAPLTTGSGSNFVAADNVIATYTRAAGENASPPTYHITATLSATPMSALDNYNITNVGAEFTINKRTATWTTNAASKTYGDADPTPLTTGSGSNFVAADNVTATYSRVAGANASPPTYHITATLSATPLSALDNYNITNVGAEFTINKRNATVTADNKTKTFGEMNPPLTATVGNQVTGDPINYTLSTTATQFSPVGNYPITVALGSNPNYNVTATNGTLTVLTACSVFNGFLAPIGGSVENGTGGSFADPVRSFKLNSTIPVKFSATCYGAPLTTGVHKIEAIKYSNATTADAALDATPTDAATTGNEFRLSGSEWHFNLSTKGLGSNGQGIWQLKATLFDGSTYSVWIEIKK